ncbi:MAG TPA: TetR/AcrR family transcriptional regulator [Caulobacteraceae bacterium]
MPRVLTETDVADFRERLCGAAERLFAERGPDGVTMRQLAAELGVSPMTPYRYFKDKDAILAAVRAAAFTRFAEALEAAFAGERDPLDRFRATGEAYVRFALAEPAAYKLMFDLMQPNWGEYPELQAASMRARRTLTAHVEGLIEAGLIKGDPLTIGLILWSALHGFVELRLAGQLPEGSTREMGAEMLKVLARGLGLTVVG